MKRLILDIVAVAKMRCIRCREGAVWKRPMSMNSQCPVCGYVFEREEGYFYGAMYASYFFSMATVFPVMFILLFTGQSIPVILGVTITQTIVQVPVAFMYSRVIWMAVDNWFDPFPAWNRPTPAHRG